MEDAVNILIDGFTIPPFLFPIYHAAGIAYGIPWEILAAINEIETDYGRNLSTSSAGAMGWMQFLPSTWVGFGIDADAAGKANPYDPIDAIFAAARYLNAAGGEKNLNQAIYAYNHAAWYVSSVELRAKLLQYLPQSLVNALNGLMQAVYPLAGHLGPYATNQPVVTRLRGESAVRLSAPVGTRVIAPADGRVVAVGHNRRLGKYVTLVDSYGDRFTYAGLGSLESVYPVIKPRVQSDLTLARRLGLGTVPRSGPVAVGKTKSPAPAKLSASAGGQPAKASPSAPAVPPVVVTPMAKERLFADPSRPASYAAGGRLQLESTLASYAAGANMILTGRGPADYYSQPVKLTRGQFTLAPLGPGAILAGGTILGHVGRAPGRTPGIVVQVLPATAKQPIDPRPIIAGWRLVGRLTAGRKSLFGPAATGAYGTSNPSLAQVLLAGRDRLQHDVLSDRRVALDVCGRRDIRGGDVDRRVLAVIEYLSYAGFAPGVTEPGCGVNASSSRPLDQLDIATLLGRPVAGHQQDGAIADLAVRELAGLQGAIQPARIISARSYPGQAQTIGRPDHANRIEVDFSRAGATRGPNLTAVLNGAQWRHLMARLGGLSSG